MPDAVKVCNEHPFHRLTDRCSEDGRYTCSMQCAQRVAPITMTANPRTESTKLRLPFHHMTGTKYDACSKTWRGKGGKTDSFQITEPRCGLNGWKHAPLLSIRESIVGGKSEAILPNGTKLSATVLQRSYQYVLECWRITDPKPHHWDNIQPEKMFNFTKIQRIKTW